MRTCFTLVTAFASACFMILIPMPAGAQTGPALAETSLQRAIRLSQRHAGNFRQSDADNAWEKVLPVSDGGRAEDIARIGQRILMTHFSDLFYSDNEGETWHFLFRAKPTPITGHHAAGLTPQNRLFVTGDTVLFHNMLSFDGGVTWDTLKVDQSKLPTYYYAPTVMTLIGNQIFVGTRYNGVVRSSDWGKSFSPVNNGYPINGWYAAPQAFGVAGNQPLAGTAMGLYLFNGTSWVDRSGIGLPKFTGASSPFYVFQDIDVHGNKWFVSTHDGLYYSENAGAEWKKSVLPNPVVPDSLNGIYVAWKNWPVGFYSIDVVDDVIYATYRNQIYRSSDGDQWIQTNLDEPVHVLRVASAGGNLILATSSGVYKATKDFTSVDPRNEGFVRRYFYSIGTNGKDVFTSAFGSGVMSSTLEPNYWTPANDGLSSAYVGKLFIGEEVSYTQMSESFLFDGIVHARAERVFVRRSTDPQWRPVDSSFPFSQILDMRFSNNALYATGTMKGHVRKGMMRSTNGGETWQQIFTGMTHFPHYEDHVTTFEPDGDTLYAGTMFGGLFRSGDSGLTWMSINGNLLPAEHHMDDPNALVSVHDIKKAANVMVFTADDMTGNGTLYVSTNRGEKWNKVDVHDLLGVATTAYIYCQDLFKIQDSFVVAVVAYNDDFSINRSVLLRSTNGTNWEEFGIGIPFYISTDLCVIGDYLYGGATAGGLYRMKLPDELITSNEVPPLHEHIEQPFPNPFSSELKLKLQNAKPGTMNVTVMDLYGALIFKQTISTIAGEQVIDLEKMGAELATWTTGLYVVQIHIGNDVRSFRIVKK